MTKLVCSYLKDGIDCMYFKSYWIFCPFTRNPQACSCVNDSPRMLKLVEVHERTNPNRIPKAK